MRTVLRSRDYLMVNWSIHLQVRMYKWFLIICKLLMIKYNMPPAVPLLAVCYFFFLIDRMAQGKKPRIHAHTTARRDKKPWPPI